MKLNNLVKMLIPKNKNFVYGRVCFCVFILLFFVLSPLPSTLPPVFGAKIHSAAGSTSATFLKIGVGARAVSMAGAFVSVCDDPYAAYWNPAGLTYLKDSKYLSFSHNDYFQGLKQEFLVYTVDGEYMKFINSDKFGGGIWAFGLNYFYIPEDMERRSGLNESDPLNPISPVEGKFKAYDMALSISHGFEYEKDWNLGYKLKFIRQSIDDESGEAFAVDVGGLRPINLLGADFMLGLSLQNLGPGIKFISKRYKLPLILKAGISKKISKGLVAFEMEKHIDNYPFLKVGIEQYLSDKFSIRGGYKYRLYGNKLGAISGLATGFGIALKNF
ncbi:MAG: PorV/PorQ family protein, partial [Elusimicrobiota bacterium]|nr:PorV/PorQ family protein [Elusimicrobiota bacterium]